MRNMLKLIRKFHDDETGSAAVELVLCVPIIVWALLSTMVYFDAYHDEAIATRAGMTVADLYSRESNAIDATYLNNSRNLLRALTETNDNPGIRVTVFQYRETQDDYRRVWSKNRGLSPNYNNTRLRDIADRLPTLSNGETAILVETQTTYTAPFTSSLNSFSPFQVKNLTGVEFNTFTVVSPRYGTSLCWKQDSTSDPDCFLSDLGS